MSEQVPPTPYDPNRSPEPTSPEPTSPYAKGPASTPPASNPYAPNPSAPSSSAQPPAAPYGQPQQGQPPAYGQPYGQAPSEQAGYGQQQYSQQQYSQQQYSQSPYGQQPQQYGAAYGQQYGTPQAPYGVQPGRDPERRPGTVTAAAVLTFVSASLVLVVAGLVGFLAAVAPDDFVTGFEDGAGMTVADGEAIAWATAVVCLVLVVWSVAAIVLGVFVLKRSNGARIALVVSAALAALVAVLGFPAGLLITACAGTAIVLVFVGGANDWFARRGADQTTRTLV